MNPNSYYQTQLNGKPATATDLSSLAFAGFAHFTAMQVRNRRVRGIELHLERLRQASMRYFGRAMPDDQVRAYLDLVINSGPENQSLVATMFSDSGEFTASETEAYPGLLVRNGPPSDGPEGPLRMMTVNHERPLPDVKDAGESAKTLYLREAVAKGYDDAAFVDRHGRIGEATIWNLAFWDGTSVIWPDAAVLPGITMGILKRQLARMGVPQRTQLITSGEIATFKGGAVMNSWTPGVAILAMDGIELPLCDTFTTLLHEAYQNEPLLTVFGLE